jgi:ATP-dependent DNA ligase
MFFSRQNKPYKFMEDHFGKELTRLLSLLPDGTELDGEFFVPGKSLSEIISIVRRSINQHVDLGEMQYYIFDINIPGIPYEERYEILDTARKSYLETYSPPKTFVVIESYLVRNKKDLDQRTQQFLAEGFEGIIIRKIHQYEGKEINPLKDSVYVHGRRNNLLKWTPWQRDEGIILEVKDGIGKNKGIAKFVVSNIHFDPTIPKSKPTFTVVPHGTADELKEIFKHPEEYLGKQYTFEYKCLSDYMVPLKPRGISLRDQEDF